MAQVFLQVIFNSLVSGLLLALVAVGFNLIFNTTRVFHLAHGAVFVSAGYILIWLLKLFGAAFSLLPAVIWVGCLLATLFATVLLSWLIEWLVYRPLDRKNSGQAITLISSMGVYLFLINLIALLFGNGSKILPHNFGNGIYWYDLVITPVQLVQFLVAVILLAGLLWFSLSKWFLPIRAIMSRPTVASVMGVNTSAIRLLAMATGSVLAAVAAILRLYDTGIDPQAGMEITLSAAVAVIIGGNGSLRGTIIAALLLTFLQTLTEWFLSAQWKQGVTFLLLILVIMWKTEGIVSFKMRVEEA